MVTRGEFNRLKELKEQKIRGLDLAILDEKISQKTYALTGEKVMTSISQIAVQSAQESLNQARLNLSIQKEKSNQLGATARFEQGMTRLHAETLTVQAQSAMLKLSELKANFREDSELFKLKFRQENRFLK
ncbi:hypothetical protein [Laspinema olomoucense]|uniref:Uncharacterized protein n=1 Tax=Laspinema olomoucense D3b TaxID=2953688 RepID=A0ABT2NGD1_9CYAN|nr:hypothetical protein [Laspinema sp. D3b]MCT7981602.1 hypothetical protein [Laspinema sp. D3b]